VTAAIFSANAGTAAPVGSGGKNESRRCRIFLYIRHSRSAAHLYLSLFNDFAMRHPLVVDYEVFNWLIVTAAGSAAFLIPGSITKMAQRCFAPAETLLMPEMGGLPAAHIRSGSGCTLGPIS